MSELEELQQAIEIMRKTIRALQEQNDKLHGFIDLFNSWENEGSAAHRAARLVDMKNMARKLKR